MNQTPAAPDSPDSRWRRFPPLSRFRVLLEAQEPLRLPPYAGSAWRGLLPMSLRRTLCVTRLPHCDDCRLQGSFAYAGLFETPALTPADRARSTALPHPLVLDVEPGAGMDLAPGAPLGFGITLIGAAVQALPYLIHALGQAGERGIGKGQGRFGLLGLDQEAGLGTGDWTPVFRADEGRYHPGPVREPHWPPAPEAVRIQLLTPLRIKCRDRFVGPQTPEASLLTQLNGRYRPPSCFQPAEGCGLEQCGGYTGAGRASGGCSWRPWRYLTRSRERTRHHRRRGFRLSGLLIYRILPRRYLRSRSWARQ